MQNIIVVKGRRVFRPWEYQILRSVLKEDQKIVTDVLLMTGMRYEELLRFRNNPDWLDQESGMIHLPNVAVRKGQHLNNSRKGNRKKETVQTERWIRLSIRAKGVVPSLFRIDLTSRPAFDQMLKRRAKIASQRNPDFIPEKISVITFRKSCASWLRVYYPNHMDHIFLSMGHSRTTELRHYLGLPYTDVDINGMTEWQGGWI